LTLLQSTKFSKVVGHAVSRIWAKGW